MDRKQHQHPIELVRCWVSQDGFGKTAKRIGISEVTLARYLGGLPSQWRTLKAITATVSACSAELTP